VLSKEDAQEFRRRLLDWFDGAQRDLPWRHTRDPYSIWISEIMLQQTRVTAAIPYYSRFLARFPTVRALAEASQTDVLAHWAGLGYYYRARNMHAAAKQIGSACAFPNTYDEIRALPGIGEYTAAALASIAFDLPHAAVDGNVLRVLSRVFADPCDTSSAAGRKHFARAADVLLDRSRPGSFNQAMMELGATVCLPSNPQCLLCPVSAICRARTRGAQASFPFSSKRMKNLRESLDVFWIERSGELLAWQRPEDSRLMPGFWELPGNEQLPEAFAVRELGRFRHGITFHDYRFRVLEAILPNELGPCRWIPITSLGTLPASTILRKAHRIVSRHRSKEKPAVSHAASE